MTDTPFYLKNRHILENIINAECKEKVLEGKIK
jgi:hypothetical protein